MPHELYRPELVYLHFGRVLVPFVLISRPFKRRIADVGEYTTLATVARHINGNFFIQFNTLTGKTKCHKTKLKR